MTTLRSEGWSVRPSFVANGPTAPVTILIDDEAFTQLAGDPAVAWQTPWSEMFTLQLVRFSKGMALFATVDGVRYCWRTGDLGDYESIRAVVLAHGGVVTRRQRRAGVYVLATVVVLGSLAGGIGALLNRGSSANHALASAQAVNLSANDLPSSWQATSTGILSYIFPPSSQVVTSTSTTAPKANSAWTHVSAYFQRCLGVSAARDRVYGAAGQMPDYQVSSKVFSSSDFGGIEVASTTQYYSTTTMVQRDVAEMSKSNFGSCFVSSNVALVLAENRIDIPKKDIGTTWRPTTFVRGWSRGGVAYLELPVFKAPLHLVMAVVTSGHFEVTLGALVDKWPESRSFLSNLVNTLLSRMTSSTSTPA